MKVTNILVLCLTTLFLNISTDRGILRTREIYSASLVSNEYRIQSKNAVSHDYKCTTVSTWNACGFKPNDSYEGWLSQAGQTIECDDNTAMHWIADGFGSVRGAKKELENRLKSKTDETRHWKIAQEFTIDSFKVIELFDAIEIRGASSTPHKWILLSIDKTSIVSIYGPDKDHVINYYNSTVKAK